MSPSLYIVPGKKLRFNGELFNLVPECLWWVPEQPYANSCKLNCPGCPFCDSQFCTVHGRSQRAKARNNIGPPPIPTAFSFAAVWNPGIYLTPEITALCRDHILKNVRLIPFSVEYLWRLHFNDKKPHLNFTFLVSEPQIESTGLCETGVTERISYTNPLFPPLPPLKPYTLYLNPSFLLEKQFRRSCHDLDALFSVIAQPNSTYIKPIKSWAVWHDYVFQIIHELRPREYPPKISGQRWHYWDKSNGFP